MMLFDDDKIKNELNQCMKEHFDAELKIWRENYKQERSSREHWQYAAFISWIVVASVLVVLYNCLFTVGDF